MAFSSHALTEVFGSATVSNGDLTIPSGSINSFVPSAANTGVYEMIFGLVDTIAGAVGTGDLSNIRVTETSTLVNETLLRKNYNFIINLDFDSDAIEGTLNVRDEPEA